MADTYTVRVIAGNATVSIEIPNGETRTVSEVLEAAGVVLTGGSRAALNAQALSDAEINTRTVEPGDRVHAAGNKEAGSWSPLW